ncbi:MAG: oligosaccharide flippase family protein [Chloroflexi bacterium]|nr:oligosaccharide flippase family protein [Chloroflexota bacterium]
MSACNGVDAPGGAPPEGLSIAARAVRGSFYSVGASAITLTLGLTRAVLLARLLLPEHFGVVTLALFYVQLADRLRALGLGRAMIHRREVDDRVVSTYFTLQMALLLGSLMTLAALAPVLARAYPGMPSLVYILWALVGVSLIKGLNAYQETFLSRDLDFRRLALADVVSSVTMTIAAPLAAWYGWGAWSLILEQAGGQIARSAVCWILPVAPTPRLGWDGEALRWFWRFGIRVWWGTNLSYLLDRFDDFWIGTALGKTPLGYYSRAYEFARYPRRIIANPLASVFFPTFARLQSDRLRLSQAFFRVTSLMIRAGFGFGLMFILAAPELIRLLIGERWLPMLTTFQLMLVYTLADPLTVVAGNLLVAAGHPGRVTRARAVQLAVFVPAVVVLGRWWGIEGVALAADLMVLVGLVLLFAQTRHLVDYSWRAMWLWPTVAVALIAPATLMGVDVGRDWSLWGRLAFKCVSVSVLYGGLLWLTEREQLRAGWHLLYRSLKLGSGHSAP